MIETYTSLEVLTDSQCRKCRVLQTLRNLRLQLLEKQTLFDAASTLSASSRRDPSVLSEDVTNPNIDKASQPMSSSKKRRLREGWKDVERIRELIKKVERLVQENRWEEDLEGVVWEWVDGGISTRYVVRG